MKDLPDRVARIETRLDAHENLLERIDRGVNGSEDSLGLKGRVDRLEQQGKFIAAIGTVVTVISGLILSWLGLRK
jgi:hypothetical protein